MKQNKHDAIMLALHASDIYVSLCIKKKFDANIIGPSPREQRPEKTGSNPKDSFRDSGNAIEAVIAPKYVENPRNNNRVYICEKFCLFIVLDREIPSLEPGLESQ